MHTTVASLVVSAAALVSIAPQAWACSCMMAHPQMHYCNSDYVIHAMVGNFTEVPEAFIGYYNVTVIEALKGLDHSDLIEELADGTNSARVYTSMYDSMCGVFLQPGIEYILTGHMKESGLQINLCGLIAPYNSLTRRQRNGFKHKFKLNCDCQVVYCGLPGFPCEFPPPPPPSCLDPANCTEEPAQAPPSDKCYVHIGSDFLGCQERHTLCQRQNGSCQWTDNNFNQACQTHTRRRLRRRRRH